jgi:hypothetical protein
MTHIDWIYEKYASMEFGFIKSSAIDFEPKLYVKVWGPYRNSRGRDFVRVKRQDGTYKTTSYAKFLMEEHLGRELNPETETVDHINSDRYDNRIENFELVPREEHSANDTRRVRKVQFTCRMCGQEFERSPRLLRAKSKEKRSGPFCSRRCAGQYGRLLALKKIRKHKRQKGQKSEYFKRKYEIEVE